MDRIKYHNQMARITDFYNENEIKILAITILLLIVFVGFIFYINIDKTIDKEFIFYKNECLNGTNSNILIGADYVKGRGELSLTYYSKNNYDLSKLDDMGGLGFDLELPKNEINQTLTFNFPSDLNTINCPNFTNHDTCFELKENICNFKEIKILNMTLCNDQYSLQNWFFGIRKDMINNESRNCDISNINTTEISSFSELEDWMLEDCKYGHIGEDGEWWYECNEIFVEVRK